MALVLTLTGATLLAACATPAAPPQAGPEQPEKIGSGEDKASDAAVDAYLAARATAPFVADLPPGFKIERRPQGVDFDVYDIVRDGTAYAGVYAGNFPSFEGDGAGEVREDGGGRKRLVVKTGGGERVVGYLIPTGQDWPAYLHVWVRDVPDDQATADRVAASVRPAPPRPGRP
jgi:hypothetical protein